MLISSVESSSFVNVLLLKQCKILSSFLPKFSAHHIFFYKYLDEVVRV